MRKQAVEDRIVGLAKELGTRAFVSISERDGYDIDMWRAGDAHGGYVCVRTRFYVGSREPLEKAEAFFRKVFAK